MSALRLAYLVFLCLALSGCLDGRGTVTARVGGVDLTVHTYRSPDCAPRGLVLVFHGNSRNADGYRDHARAFADRFCLTVLAPLFDRDRFPNRRYHRGGLVSPDGPVPAGRRTVDLVPGLVDWARTRAGPADGPVYLFGHSAGGQFLSRVAAFARLPNVARIVAANPSSHVWPSLDESIPYGLGGLPAGTGEEVLAAYLAAPLTLYLGAGDTGAAYLHNAPPARRQGANRLDRGRRAFATGRAAAARRGLPFNWRLVEAAEVGHSARRMLSAPEAAAAFGLDPGPK